MGLTIHYKFEFRGSKTDAYAMMVRLHRHAVKNLPTSAESRVYRVRRYDFQKRNAKSEHWKQLGPETGWYVTQSSIYRNAKIIYPPYSVGFGTWPGDGCEPANFGLSLMPDSDNEWVWSSFCKTQYASNPECGGIHNFMKCHLFVISMLDKAKELGILVDVNDEGEYWQTRDITHLGRMVGDYNAFISALAFAFKDAMEDAGIDDMRLEAPIFDYPNAEHLEVEGKKYLRNNLGKED